MLVPDLADGSPGAEHVVLRSVRDGEPELTAATPGGRTEDATWWHVDLLLVNRTTRYRFFISGTDGSYHWLNAEGLHDRDLSDAGDFLVRAEDYPPAWVPDQIAYQIFPDRFAPSAAAAERETPGWAVRQEWSGPVRDNGKHVEDHWFAGDLDGIIERLDHIVELGATVLYLTPVFEGRSNHRYDAVSFDRVDPALGGDEALERLINAAHERGIRVLGDLTTNHTGSGHEWFLTAQADATSPEAGFYRFRHHPDDYVAWWDIPSLPKLDHANAELRARLYEGEGSIVARWLRAGLDGWRINVANMTGRMGGDDLANDVARRIRATMQEVNPEAWLLAEHGHDASADLVGDGWDGTMDYQGFTRPVWVWLNAEGTTPEAGAPTPVSHGLDFLGLPINIPVLPGTSAAGTMRDVHARMSWAAQSASTLHLDSHDTPRFRTVVGGGTDGWVDAEGRGRTRHLLGLALQMTMPGVPSIFAGDELGLTGTNGEHARTPMPWDAGVWDTPTWDAYRAWVALRRDHVALRRGGLRWVDIAADSLTYLREHPSERILVHVVRPSPGRSAAAAAPVTLEASLLGVQGARALVGEDLAVTGADVVLPTTVGAHVYQLDTAGWEWND
ncbi:glycoside hydrolase family 13 protein [Salana multivorans]